MGGRTTFLLIAVVLVGVGLAQYALGATLAAILAWAFACVMMAAALTYRNGG